MRQNRGALARALYSNTPEARNELLFRKGDILTVIEYDYDGQPGWWLCAHRGHRGMCPSNYLELLEDNYSLPASKILSNQQKILSQSTESKGPTESVKAKEGEGILRVEKQKEQDEIDPLELYDLPRSCAPNLSKASSLHQGGSSDALDSTTEPLYENEVPLSPVTKTSPFDLYDIPRSELPVYGQSLARLRKFGPDITASDTSLSCENSFRSNLSFSDSGPCQSYSDLGLPPSGNTRSTRISPINSRTASNASINTIQGSCIQSTPELNKHISQVSGTSPVTLRRPNRQPYFITPSSTVTAIIPPIENLRFSTQSESSESRIGMVSSPPPQDLYDVPRSLPLVSTSSNGHGSSSRPQSSCSTSELSLSIANSESKDSLDNMYDVPRSAKTYVNRMEAKYDQIQGRSGSTASLVSDDNVPSASNHSRHNSTSSIFSAYGYTKAHGQSRTVPSTDFTDGKRDTGKEFGSRSSIASASSSIHGQVQPGNELYDVPRSVGPPPPNRRLCKPGISISSASLASAKSKSSLRSEGHNHNHHRFNSDMDYDVPASMERSLSLRDSTDTLDFQESFRDESHELKLGASSSSLSYSSSSRLRSVSQCNNESGSSGATAGSGNGSSEVKILPLGPKAAVSVCEKLRQEVVTSIGSILDHVKPRWRYKENLNIIMPDLRFACVRLSLAIKDLADFASRTMSNAKKQGDETLLTKLNRLLIPVIKGSQIIQRDVDELEAYFWSVDRLSVTQGSQYEKNISGDALDQLILCARSLKHDVTEIANFLALNSSVLFCEKDRTSRISTQMAESKVEDPQEDYDYVSLVPTNESEGQSESSPPKVPPHSGKPPLELDSRDQQLLEFYSAQIAVTGPLLSQHISNFISAIHQNEPPESFNIHLKYIILLAYKMLFAGDTVHRNVDNAQLKTEIEEKANSLHKAILTLYEASRTATIEFPKIGPMQSIVDKVWATTQAATQLKKIIFDATSTSG